MKMILSSSYGGFMPDVVACRLNEKLGKESVIKARFDEKLISYIESSAIVYDEKIHTQDWFSKNKDKIILCKTSGNNIKYIGWHSDGVYGNIASVSIVDIDVSRRWTINVYDGAESIKYVDVWECKDESLNYWVEKR